MIGRNTIELNVATVIEAVQMWLDSKLKTQDQKIVSVNATDENTFMVEIEQTKGQTK